MLLCHFWTAAPASTARSTVTQCIRQISALCGIVLFSLSNLMRLVDWLQCNLFDYLLINIMVFYKKMYRVWSQGAAASLWASVYLYWHLTNIKSLLYGTRTFGNLDVTWQHHFVLDIHRYYPCGIKLSWKMERCAFCFHDDQVRHDAPLVTTEKQQHVSSGLLLSFIVQHL